jgi:peptide-methionine (S)-S-oxide reductase
MNLFTRKTEMVAPDQALPGRDTPLGGLGPHLVLGTPIVPPFPEGHERFVVGMGCFWGADRPF